MNWNEVPDVVVFFSGYDSSLIPQPMKYDKLGRGCGRALVGVIWITPPPEDIRISILNQLCTSGFERKCY